ncbi:hypothetical protein GO988_18145 [Hymenobacter sp. HMF4947]|uniref:Uncharacterized protein n=1 Tax=Hymenobacter ginkgonis TaxID=2682976 RepID=A0A7K1TIP3_9BACT|nr:hypothetical protein [Hymenobacter ginkgonis]MVN78255.1 hypothetical protein [Hymenobacter ginkgonis]
MAWLPYVSYFFGGAFLANALPHLLSGTMGQAFQSPFAKPPGVGLSSATVNVFWGVFNLVASYLLVLHVGKFSLRATLDALVLGLGVLLMALQLARHFGQLHGGNAPVAPPLPSAGI